MSRPLKIDSSRANFWIGMVAVLLLFKLLTVIFRGMTPRF